MRLLNQQVGVVDFTPYAPLFRALYASSRAVLPGLSHSPSLFIYSHRNARGLTAPSEALPSIPLRLEHLISRLQTAYQLTTKAKFAEAVERFRSIMLSVPLLVLDNNKEEAEAKDLITICKEYIIGLQMEMMRKTLPKETDEVISKPAFINLYKSTLLRSQEEDGGRLIPQIMCGKSLAPRLFNNFNGN